MVYVMSTKGLIQQSYIVSLLRTTFFNELSCKTI